MNSLTPETIESCEEEKDSEAGAGAVTDDTTRDRYAEYLEISLAPDLCEILMLWPKLPAHIKAGIVAMIKAGIEQQGQYCESIPVHPSRPLASTYICDHIP